MCKSSLESRLIAVSMSSSGSLSLIPLIVILTLFLLALVAKFSCSKMKENNMDLARSVNISLSKVFDKMSH